MNTNIFGKSSAGSPVLGSRNNSKSQYTQCQRAARKHIPDKMICDNATPSKLQIPGFETLSPVTLQPPHESVTPRRVINGITNMPCRHIGFKTGSDGSNTANSYKAIEPAQPATNDVCIKCTASNLPGSFKTTV